MKLSGQLVLALLAAAPLPAPGQAAEKISGPTLGFVLRDGSLRPLLGIPGAAHFGAPLSLDRLDVIAVCETSRFALALDAGRTSGGILDAATGRLWPLELPSPVRAAYCSPLGSAMLLSREAGVDIVTGYAAQSLNKKTVELETLPAAAAVSDDGETAAVFLGGALRLIDAGGQKQIAVSDAVPEFAFQPASNRLVYIDGNSVVLASREASAVVASAADRLSEPRLPLFSRDARSVFLIDGQELLALPAAGSGAIDRTSLPCAPAGLALLDGSTLHLRCRESSRSYLVERSPAGMRIMFVPEPVE